MIEFEWVTKYSAKRGFFTLEVEPRMGGQLFLWHVWIEGADKPVNGFAITAEKAMEAAAMEATRLYEVMLSEGAAP